MNYYHIFNRSRHTTIARRAERAQSFWARLRGLMFRKHLDADSGLVIEPNKSVHTFWMRFPIDVIFVDRSDRVVGLAPRLVPHRPYAGARDAWRTIELPAGAIERSATQLGDQLELQLAD